MLLIFNNMFKGQLDQNICVGLCFKLAASTDRPPVSRGTKANELEKSYH